MKKNERKDEDLEQAVLRILRPVKMG